MNKLVLQKARSAFDSEGSLFNEEQVLKLKKTIRELEKIRGRHTELVSVYVPADYNLNEMIGQLMNEKGTASNIKSKSTRKNVLTALEKIVNHLRLFKQTPKNGIVVFCGNISQVEGREDIQLRSIEPTEKLTTKTYWCDQVFVLEPLKEMIEEKEVYGLIVLDAREANVGLMSGKRIQTLKNMDSTVPGKTVKGGMSQSRYDGIREDAINEFLTKVGEVASQLFLQQKSLIGVIIGGPGPVKERFFKDEYLNYQIQKKVLGVKDVGYTGDYGLEELVKRSEDLMKEAALVRERDVLQKFFTELQKTGKAVYGYVETKKALEIGAVETLIVSEDFDWVHVKLKCANGHADEKDVAREEIMTLFCPQCKQRFVVQEEVELFDEIVDQAKGLGTEVELVSPESSEGKQFKKIGGIGAILRWKV